LPLRQIGKLFGWEIMPSASTDLSMHILLEQSILFPFGYIDTNIDATHAGFNKKIKGDS